MPYVPPYRGLLISSSFPSHTSPPPSQPHPGHRVKGVGNGAITRDRSEQLQNLAVTLLRPGTTGSGGVAARKKQSSGKWVNLSPPCHPILPFPSPPEHHGVSVRDVIPSLSAHSAPSFPSPPPTHTNTHLGSIVPGRAPIFLRAGKYKCGVFLEEQLEHCVVAGLGREEGRVVTHNLR